MRKKIWRFAAGTVAAAALAATVVVASPKPAEATVFCNTNNPAQTLQRTYGGSTKYVIISWCAEHGGGWYRSYADAITVGFNGNFKFIRQRLYYYCDDGVCNAYDVKTNDGYVNTDHAISRGNTVGCPGASNTGLAGGGSGPEGPGLIQIRWSDGFLSTNNMADSGWLQFNSNC